MRSDRADDDFRQLKFELDYVPWADGSVLISTGRTTVLCNAGIQDGVPSHCVEKGIGWITAEYAMLPQSSIGRSSRDGRPNIKGRTIEIQRIIGRSLRAAVDLKRIKDRSVVVDCDVLIADGGTRTASVTGAWLALRMAFHRMFQGDVPDGLLTSPWVAGISAGRVQGRYLLDLDYEEDSTAEVDLNFIGTADSRWIEIQTTSESVPQSQEVFEKLVALASRGVTALCKRQEEAFREWKQKSGWKK